MFGQGVEADGLGEDALAAERLAADLHEALELLQIGGMGGGGVVTLADGSAIATRPVAGGAGAVRLTGPRLGEFEGTGIHYARRLMDARLWVGKPQRSGSRQFGRTSVSDIVFFPARGAVLR